MIRLVLIVLLFLISLLCVAKAPLYYLWFVAILVEEFPWLFIGLEFMLVVWGNKVQHFQTVGNVIAGISLILFSLPVINAYLVSAKLPEELVKSFPLKERISDARPYSFVKMLTGIGVKKIPFTTMVYSSETTMTLDFYPAQRQGRRPCIVVIHGGSWAAGDSQQLPELNSVLSLAGYNVASINYRLAPAYKSPAPVEDTQTAIRFLKANSLALDIDTTKFVLLGRSAGGQIALTAAYTLREPGIIGVVGFYAPADMVWGYSQPANPLIMDSKKVMEDYLGGTIQQVPENYAASSAINFVTPATVPTLLIHGKKDVLVFYEHSVRLLKKLNENKVPCYFLAWPTGTHGGDYTLNGPSGQLSTYAITWFLNWVEALERPATAKKKVEKSEGNLKRHGAIPFNLSTFILLTLFP